MKLLIKTNNKEKEEIIEDNNITVILFASNHNIKIEALSKNNKEKISIIKSFKGTKEGCFLPSETIYSYNQ